MREATAPEGGDLILDGKPFRHRMEKALDTRIHFVEGGSGPVVVFIAGYPQSWYAWRKVLPLLEGDFHVLALDLPGQGDSDHPLGGFDAKRTGDRVHGLLTALGHSRYALVGHDIGAWVSYPYAHRFANEVERLVLLDANIPGVTLRPVMELSLERAWKSWHFLLNAVPDLPETLFVGRERALIEWFYQRKSANPAAAFTSDDIDEYARVYQKPGGLRSMLGYYRAVYADMVANQGLASAPLAMPVLALGGDVGAAPDMFEAMKPLADRVEGGVLERCGHYIPEEQPHVLALRLREFLLASA